MRLDYENVARAIVCGLTLLSGAAFAEAAAVPSEESSAGVAGTATTKVSPDVLNSARELIRNNQAAEAYALLKPYETDWAGNADYDYLYGVAALDSGHPDEAVFSLQRVVAVNPGYPAARMELARAYYEVGDHEASRREFERLQQADPPPFARRVIGNYLTAIEKNAASRGGGSPNNIALYVEAGVGYDSNANGSTENDQFLGFTLDATNVKQDAFFGQMALGLRLNGMLTSKLQGFVEGSTRQRWNTDAEFVNFSRSQIGTGLLFRDGPVDLFGSLSAFSTYLDSDFPFTGDYNHNGQALDLGGGRYLSEQTRVGVEFRASPIRYDRNQRIRDVTQYVGALSLDQHWKTPAQPKLTLSGIFGVDDERRADSPYGRSIYGLRSVVGWTAYPKILMNLQAGYLFSDYDGRFFGEQREDHQFVVGGSIEGYNFPSPVWSWSPYLLYVANSSNVELFDYDRVEVGISIRFTPRFNLPSTGGGR